MVHPKGVKETPLTPMRASRPPHQNHKKRDALMATPQQEKPLFQEGRLVLAINAYNQCQF